MPVEIYTKIGLISNALILLGEKPLNSLSDDRYGATTGANLFENVYEAELQSNRWRFAMKKGALSRLVDVPLNEYQYVYQLPTDMLLLIGMTFPQDYEIYGGKHLYTSATTVEVEYLFKPEVTELPAYFALLLTYSLAKNMVNPITEGSAAKIATMVQAYRDQLPRAQYADAQARPARPIIHSPFTENR